MGSTVLPLKITLFMPKYISKWLHLCSGLFIFGWSCVLKNAMTLWFARATPDVMPSETTKAGGIFGASRNFFWSVLVSQYHFSTLLLKYWCTSQASVPFFHTPLLINWLTVIGSFFFALGDLWRWHSCFCMFLFPSTLATLVKTRFYFLRLRLLRRCTPLTTSYSSYVIPSAEGVELIFVDDSGKKDRQTLPASIF